MAVSITFDFDIQEVAIFKSIVFNLGQPPPMYLGCATNRQTGRQTDLLFRVERKTAHKTTCVQGKTLNNIHTRRQTRARARTRA